MYGRKTKQRSFVITVKVTVKYGIAPIVYWLKRKSAGSQHKNQNLTAWNHEHA